MNVIFLFVFYFVFSPIGLICKLFKIDLISQIIDRNTTSYWDNSNSTHNDITRFQLHGTGKSKVIKFFNLKSRKSPDIVKGDTNPNNYPIW